MPPFYIFIFALFGVILVVGLLDNSLVILIAAKIKSDQKSVNIYLGHLAAADILHLLSIIPLMHLSRVQSWTWGDFACKAFYIIHYTNWTASIFIITAMAFDRFIAVVLNNYSSSLRSRRFAWRFLLLLWLLGALLVTPIGLFSKVTAWGEGDEVTYSCGHLVLGSNSTGSNSSTTVGNFFGFIRSIAEDGLNFVIYNFVVGCLIPLVLISVFYGLIQRKVRRHAAATGGPNQAQQCLTRLNKTVFAIILSYFICYAPHWFHVFLGHGGLIPPEHASYSAHITSLMPYVNSALNPILYAYFNKQFRDGSLRLLPDWLLSRLGWLPPAPPLLTPQDTRRQREDVDKDGLNNDENIPMVNLLPQQRSGTVITQYISAV